MSREPAYSHALIGNKIYRQRVRSKNSGVQTFRRLWWIVFGVETGMDVCRRGWIRIRSGWIRIRRGRIRIESFLPSAFGSRLYLVVQGTAELVVVRLIWLGQGVLQLSIGNNLPIGLLETFLLYRLSVPQAHENPLFVSEDTDPGRERLWIKWRYINMWVRT